MKVNQKNERRMYKDLAWTYPIISPKEDYIREADEFYIAIKENSRIPLKTLLHFGCGGGHLDYTFKKYFKATGVDVSKGMLSLAKKLNPEVKYFLGDMRNVRLHRTFDAVLIADSITYMLTEQDLELAFMSVYEHLKPGGVFITVAEETKERFKQNRVLTSLHKQGDTEIAFIENLYDADPNDTVFESVFVYLIRRDGKLGIETDHHICGLFSIKAWQKLLQDSGFKVKEKEFFAEKIPGFICIRP